MVFGFWRVLCVPDPSDVSAGSKSASFFSSSLVERRPAFNFVDLYIPANPFNSLANNVVPAVVLFSIILGIALVGVEHRERLLNVLQVAKDAISTATRLVTRLTPYGLFAIAANAAGTLGSGAVEPSAIYLVAYVAVAADMSLWCFQVWAALTRFARGMFSASPARTLSSLPSSPAILFIVLPGLTQASPHAPGAARPAM